MPLVFGPNFVEGKVYRGKKKKDEDEETQALREIQSILSNKNRRMCDCEAQIHDLVENCLGCGRLTCSTEGPGKCFHCGNLVIGHEQRDRLQKHIDIFQAIPATSSSAQQTQPSNAGNQFDHFTIDSMKHLSDEERKKLRDDLVELESLKHKRKYMLDIDVENAEVNYRSEPVIEDYEEQLKLLQLSHQPTESETNMVLSELVAAEAKRRYNFTYIEPSEVKKSKPKSESKSNQPEQSGSSSKHRDQSFRKNERRDKSHNASQNRKLRQNQTPKKKNRADLDKKPPR